MTTVRFLVDEHVPELLVDALLVREPAMELLLIGDIGAPPRRTPDPTLLQFAETAQYALLTQDKRTMPSHHAAHLASGHHSWGVFELRTGYRVTRYVDELVLIWAASEAEE